MYTRGERSGEIRVKSALSTGLGGPAAAAPAAAAAPRDYGISSAISADIEIAVGYTDKFHLMPAGEPRATLGCISALAAPRPNVCIMCLPDRNRPGAGAL